MSHIEKRGPGRYRARWNEPGGRERSKTFERKTDAVKFLATVDADQLRGQYVDPHDKTTVLEYARQWAEGRPHRPTSARRTASNINNHIAGTALGERRLASVLPSDVQAWVSDRAARLAPSTLDNLVSLIRSVFTAAAQDRLIGTSPAIKLTLPASRPERVVPLTVQQVVGLASAMPPRNEAMVLVQAGLGLRIGELLALRLEDVDFLHQTVRIDWQTDDETRSLVDVKTPTSHRTIPLPRVVAEALSRHIATFPPAEDGTLFHTRFGQFYRRDYYGTTIFKKAVHKAGLPKGTTSHDLRHHYASVLIERGESLVAVAERLGHENATLVMTTYGHLMPNSEARTRKAVDDAWSEVLDGLGTASASA
ncbi:tyrosine-type recombinase/integrase [Kineococcus aurantiacus]|uniref:Integrase n=1 Tax=Kineococcus aurantiacus TaxID=37633 RepID=A0A7Y9DNP2_9ACTN|nr:site-specific integrase [Kineococcus aurantiacus]NYD23972.1 integrase [Kineococcus aurantiacus]